MKKVLIGSDIQLDTINNIARVPNVYGYSKQDSLPTSKSPVEIKNLGHEGNISILKRGKNFFDPVEAVNEENLSYDNTYVFFEIKGVKPNTAYTISNLNLVDLSDLGYGVYAGLTIDNVYSTGPGIAFYSCIYNNVYTNNTGIRTGYSGTEEQGGKLYFCIATNNYDSSIAIERYLEVFERVFANAQIEEGSIVTEYEPYQGQIFNFPLEEGQVLHKEEYLLSAGIYTKRKTIVFDGTENWKKDNNQDNDVDYFYIHNTGIDKNNIDTVMCSHFIKADGFKEGFWATTVFCITIPKTQTGIISTDTVVQRIEKFKTWLAEQYANGTPVTLEYELSSPSITPYTSVQQSVYNDMQNIELINGTTYFTILNTPKTDFKLLYSDKNIKDKQVYVFDKDEVLLAVFNKDDEDTIINPRISKTQNAESVFTFQISPRNPKWEQIRNPENLYMIDNKMFSTNFEGCFTEVISDNNEDLIQVTAYERQKLLTRKYVRAWNSETGFENIDIFMVVVLSNGDLALKNNDEYVGSSHLPGTSGYALDALLYGTGWTTGECDVEGTFDLETDQVDIYENILKVQQIWGGILVFDSVNKIVHHRDETKYLPYSGYEVRYQKNMQSLEKLYNNKIITKLCPLGEGGLNIKSVNNGSEWLIDNSYTTSVLEGIENNADIYDSEQLKRWGERKLKDLCKPRKELTVQGVLLEELEGFELETIDLNDVVDIINYGNIEADIEQLRVVGFDYSPWDYSDAIIELSDITLESTDIFKKTVSASNTINNGTLNSNKVVNFFKNGQTITQSLRIVDETIEQVKSDFTKKDDEISASIEKFTTEIDNLNSIIVSQTQEIASLKLTIEGLEAQAVVSGGNNLIKNSVGAFDNEYWEGNVLAYTDTDVQNNNESKSSFNLQSGSMMQEILNIKNGTYNLSFNYKKLLSAAITSVIINEEEYVLTNTNWEVFEKVINITNHYFKIEFVSDTNNSCLISDLLLIAGKYKQTWSQNANETDTETVKIGKGIQVESEVTNTYTRIDSDGNRTFNSTTGEVVAENTDKGTSTENLVVRTEAQITGVLQQQIEDQVWLSLLI